VNPELTLSQFQGRLSEASLSFSTMEFSGLLKTIGRLGVADMRSKMAQGISPDGRPYRPLAHGRVGQGGATARPLRQSGALMASINYRVNAQEVTWGSSLLYASLHQEGGTIRPRVAKWLAIPLTAQASRAGSPRRFSGPLAPIIGKSKRSGVMVDQRGHAQYALVKEVRIPARRFIGISEDLLDQVDDLLSEALAAKLIAAIEGKKGAQA
jgi:phage gpG-like protein